MALRATRIYGKVKKGQIFIDLICFKGVENLEVSNILDIHFDRMTILGDLNSKKVFEFKQLLKSDHISLIDGRFHDCVRGKFLSDLVYFEYDKIKAKSFNTRNFRMEFNPNHLTEEQVLWLQINVIPLLSDVGITRLDLAFDVDFDLSQYEFLPVGNSRQKSTVEFRDASRKLETLYIGKRQSDKMVRLYNKRLEQEKKGNTSDLSTWWRLEFELKRETVDEFGEVFDTLQIKKPILNDLEKIEDKAILYYLLDRPQEWSNLSKRKKEKYRKMLREIKEEDITFIFKEGLKKKKAELLQQLDDWFKNQYKIFNSI